MLKKATGAVVDGYMAGDVHGQGTLAHPRAARHHHQGGRLQSPYLAIEIDQAGREAGDVQTFGLHLLQPLQHLRKQVPQHLQPVTDPVLGHRQHPLLGLVEDDIDFHIQIHRQLGDLVAGGQHPPAERMLLHDPGVIAHVRGAGHRIPEPDHETRSAGLVQIPCPVQLVDHGHGVDRLVLVVETAHRSEDRAVGRNVEVLGR